MIRDMSKRFNRVAEHSFGISANRSFLAFSFVAGVAALPFSTTFALMLFAAPTLYAGVGLATKGLAKGLERIAPAPGA